MNEIKKNKIDENPPVFKKWKSWYILVLANLTFLIVLFYIFTKYFE